MVEIKRASNLAPNQKGTNVTVRRFIKPLSPPPLLFVKSYPSPSLIQFRHFRNLVYP